LVKARQTAEEILSYHLDKQFEFTSFLRERSLGLLEGKREKDVRKLFIDKGIRKYRPEGGESLEDLMERIEMFLGEEVITKYCKKNILEKEKSQISSLLSKPKNIFKKRQSDGKLSNNLFEKSNSDLLFDDIKQDNEYLKHPFEKLLDNFEFKKITKVYSGLDTDLNIPRILFVTHKVYIQELLNYIRKSKGITNYQNYADSNDTALYIFKVFCPQCVGICYSKNEKCKLDYEVILYNNIEHLG
jgi:hypothetical protein